ncbi:hypothetical protein [Kamptonema sp. UHCC 0994]|uniref:hypothetical protein n=1 Tax=Kamptonema sp. UHCC 0994 TaxID=3031329 RepID=UPI0023B9C2EB|nr:hypothetical protein [Kamptonema sp. UHCC 0994]MDF0555385.1 hypothetical protein [Kamptonema sp. UHCC 0994]
MYNFLRVILFATLLSGVIIPSQKLENHSISEQLLQTSQKMLLAQEASGGTCGDTPTQGCGRRDSSAHKV